MTALLVLAAAAVGFTAGWLICRAKHAALRFDRDLQEQAADSCRNAADKATRHLERMVARPEIAARAHRLAERRWAR